MSENRSNSLLVSVVIPVKNAMPWIQRCLDGLLSQTIYSTLQVIIIDSGSIDGTLDVIRKSPFQIVEILPEDFNHGQTRNFGVQMCKGDFILMTVQDAYPCDKDWIKKMLDVFEDPEVMAVCGKQVVPHERDKNPVEWYRPVSKGEVIKYKFTEEEFDALSPADKKNVCSWDDVTAMYRREALLEIPFQRTTYAEDAIWAKEALKKGYTIAYNPEAAVYHYHLENADFTFKRALTVSYYMYRHFGYIYPDPHRSFIGWLRIIKTLLKSKPLTIFERIKWFKYNIEQYTATKKAWTIFTEAVAKGDSEIDDVYTRYCSKPPIPLKSR